MAKSRITKAKTTKHAKHTNSHAWFMAVRGSYLPANAAGWLSYVPFIAYIITSLVLAIHDTSSFGIAVLIVVPNWVAAAVIMTWVARRKS
jgi:hypothetical protein